MSNVAHVEPTFFKQQVARVSLRWRLFSSGLIVAAFWTVAVAVGVWLEHVGLGFVAYALLAFWVLLALPSALIQLALMVDLGNYGLTRRMLIFPYFLQGLSDAQPIEPTTERRTRSLVGLIARVGDTTPLSPFATWCIIVLLRAPLSSHIILEARERAPRPRMSIMRGEQTLIGRVEERYLDDLMERG